MARASLVAKVRILKSAAIKVEGLECAYEYEAHVSNVQKGRFEGKGHIYFGFLGGLEIGHSYVVYIRTIRDRKTFVTLMEERNPSNQDVGDLFKKCPISLPTRYFIGVEKAAKPFNPPRLLEGPGTPVIFNVGPFDHFPVKPQ